jgi:hypothetical protein
MKTDKKEILRELLLSENRGYVVALKIRGIDQAVKTMVKSVEHNRIILESTCVYGNPLERTILTLLDIEWAKRYKALFCSPVLESIRIIRNNLQVVKAGLKMG